MNRHINSIIIAILAVSSTAAVGKDEGRSADEVAKELSNPAGALASLVNNVEYTSYKGDLSGASKQEGWTYSFQPVMPFPVGDKGRRIIFRPLIPVPMNQPYFNETQGVGRPIIVNSGDHSTIVSPGMGQFEDGNLNLGDISFDLVYAGTEMKTKHDGYLWGVGVAGTLPTATSDYTGGDQWRLGPEVFGGLVRKWGTLGLLVNHQWNVGGSNNTTHSVSAGQYFYAYGLGDGWQIASGPNYSYDWKADSDQRLTLPVGIGLAKTTKFSKTPVKFQAQIQYFVEQPDAFGPDWLLKFSVTPVVKNFFIRD